MALMNDESHEHSKETQNQLRAIQILDAFTEAKDVYVIIFKTKNNPITKEMAFNRVMPLSDEGYLISMHSEWICHGMYYEQKQSIQLMRDEIIEVYQKDKNEYDFIVYTD
ncbi:hypothetical protein SAMN05421734_103167 [Pelagirhabdus alkalitolerans]|uniref:Uncharacterized protein n=1 Tax=Pelagirhabdus alkalitolerans TaxID=1612202 RepID=A0A1G6HQ39_9BACI|nr:hypothetical protein [Pelagirhabdus alkalitolerans]SDB96360.1 hypothetical protein SAMN05421734_103167 [Pelagirhabdus alkalitolerans]